MSKSRVFFCCFLVFLSFIGFIWPWLWTTAEFLCWSQVNVLQPGARSSPVDSRELQFIYIILISGDVFAVLAFIAQIIGLCQNKSEVFLSGVFKVDFDLISQFITLNSLKFLLDRHGWYHCHKENWLSCKRFHV